MLSTLLGSVFWLAVTLGVLITFHEFGHFWVARRCGVKVLQFSVGFGRVLWKHTGRDGTQYQVAAIPLGGYVRMQDARSSEVPEDQRDAAFWQSEFTSKSVLKRMAIIAAGPAFNFLFTIAAFWVMFMLGARVIAPVVMATPHSLAAQAGVELKDRVAQVQGEPVTSYNEALEALTNGIMSRSPMALGVVGQDGKTRTLHLPLDRLPAGLSFSKAIEAVGLRPASAPPIADQVVAGKPADRAGMKDGDVLRRIDGQLVVDFEGFHQQLQEAAEHERQVHVDVLRGRDVVSLTIAPTQQSLDGDSKAWVVGIQSAGPTMVIQRYGPIKAAQVSLDATWKATAQTVTMIGQMLTGRTSARNVSGAIGIAQVANSSAELGLAPFLKFLALVSLSLAVVNLLPIPLLDGGQLVYLVIEAVKGRPVNPKAMQIGQMISIFLLVALMSLAMANDVHRLLTN